jgi:molecular chaperone DnaK (HSP70)
MKNNTKTVIFFILLAFLDIGIARAEGIEKIEIINKLPSNKEALVSVHACNSDWNCSSSPDAKLILMPNSIWVIDKTPGSALFKIIQGSLRKTKNPVTNSYLGNARFIVEVVVDDLRKGHLAIVPLEEKVAHIEIRYSSSTGDLNINHIEAGGQEAMANVEHLNKTKELAKTGGTASHRIKRPFAPTQDIGKFFHVVKKISAESSLPNTQAASSDKENDINNDPIKQAFKPNIALLIKK